MIKAPSSLAVQWNLRMGVHAGPVVAGKLGRKK